MYIRKTCLVYAKRAFLKNYGYINVFRGKRGGVLLSHHKMSTLFISKVYSQKCIRAIHIRLPSSLMSRDDLKFKCNRVFIHSKGCIKLKKDLFFKRILKDRKLIWVSGHISILYDMFKNVALNFPSAMVVEMSQFTVAK